MNYKYIIRKLKKNKKNIYIPIIRNNNDWKYLIFNSDKFMVSTKNRHGFDNLIDAYKFIAKHRININAKGKDRPKCFYYKEFISFIPIFGLLYFLINLNKNITIKYLYSSSSNFITMIFIQSFSFILTLLLLL